MRWKLAVLTLSLGLGASFGVAAPAMGQTSAAQEKTAINKITDLSVKEEASGTYVRIKGSSHPTFSVYKLTSPLRLLIDVSNSEIGGEPQTEKVDNGVISQVALLEFSDSVQSITRVIVGFDQAAHYDVRTEGNDVVVFVDGAKRAAKSGNVAQVEEQLRQSRTRLEETRAQLAKLESTYRERLDASEVRVGSAQKELDRTRGDLARAERELASLRTQLENASGSERDRVSADIARQQGAIDGLKESLAAQKSAVASLKADNSRLAAERDAERARAAELVAKTEDALRRAEKVQRERDEALALVSTKDREGKAARARATELEARLDATKTDLQRAERAARQSQDVVAARSRELDEARARQKVLEQQIQELRSSASEDDKSAAMLASLDKERTALERSLSLRQNELDAARRDARDASARLDELKGALAARDAEIAKLKKEVDVARAAQARPAAKAVPVELNTVQAIRLETAEGRSRVVVDLERPGAFETVAGADGRAVMVLNGAELPRDLEKTLAGTQGGAVRFLSTYRDENGQVRLEAELGRSSTEVVRQDGNTLVWEFAPNMTQQFAAQTAGQQTRSTAGNSFTAAPPGYPRVVTDPTRVSSVPGMSRKRLTIDLREVDIQNLLRLLAKEGGVNIVSGEGVKGTVTLRLRSVPLDEVFLTVLQSRNLGFEKRGNVIRVAPQDTLRKEEAARAEERARNAKQKPLEVFLMPVNYADAGDLEKQVAPLLSPRGTVTVDERTNTLIIKDIAENLGAVRSLVGNLDSEVPQVLIEARIVETNDTFNQQFGIQWGGDLTFSQANGNPTGLIFPHVLGLAGGATDGQTPTAGTSSNPNFAVNLPAPAGTGTGGALGLTLGSVGGALNINLRLSALESAGHAKIISAPKILTLDNRAATISQGTSIPISVVSAAGVQTVFVDATLELTVEPHVTPDGNIQLKIEASKNEPDFQNTGARGDPTIIRKQASTELLIKDGDTTVIGGIYTRNAGSAVNAVPFLHKIPILGYFFRTTTESDRRTELLIFITPKIVNRAKALGATSGGTVAADAGEIE